MKTFLLLVLLSLASVVMAQDAKEILTRSIRTIDSLQSLSYDIDILQTNPMNGDTIHSNADCHLKRVQKDTITGVYYYFSLPDSGFYQYDGREYYSYSPEYNNFIIHYSLKDHPEQFRSISYPPYIIPSPVKSVSFYSEGIFTTTDKLNAMIDCLTKGSGGGNHSFTFQIDTLIDNKGCYCFRDVKKGKSTTYSLTLFIDKKSYLPVAIISDARGGSVELNNQKISLDQYTRVRFSEIRDHTLDFDSLIAANTLPKGVNVYDHNPNALLETFKIGDVAPTWKHPEVVTDNLISSDSLKGKIVVLDFTSTWCIHCIEGSNVIRELNHKFSNHNDVIFVDCFSYSKDTKEKVEKYIKKQNIEGLVVYKAGSSEKAYGVYGYPQFFLVDRTGRIAWFQKGYSTDLKERLSAEIDKCLAN